MSPMYRYFYLKSAIFFISSASDSCSAIKGNLLAISFKD